jgi:hypothetical protein
MQAERTTLPSQRSGTRQPVAIEAQPFAPNAHLRALLERDVLIAPLVVTWRYRVADHAAFRGWLDTKEILLAPARMRRDPVVAGIIYAGTYRVEANEPGPAASCRTVWGYGEAAAMQAMQELGSGSYEHATLSQLELIDFLTGLKKFIAGGGGQFTQDVMIAAATP